MDFRDAPPLEGSQEIFHSPDSLPSAHWTFDEFQNSMGGVGKDIRSMSIDELLKEIWPAEENVANGSAPGCNLQRQGFLTLPPTLSQKTVDEVWRDLYKENGGAKDGNVSRGSNLEQRQPTVAEMTLEPRTLSQKTVDEVWRDLFEENGGAKDGNVNRGSNLEQRQLSLGEMTLEQFLVRAGVVKEDTQIVGKPNNNGFYGDLSRSDNNTGLALDRVMANRITESCNSLPNQSPSLASNASEVPTFQQQRQQQQQQLFPKQATVAYASPMHLANTSQLASPGMKGGIADPTVNNGLVQGGGMDLVGLGAGAVTVATESPANHLSSDETGKSNEDTSSLSPGPYVFNGGPWGRKCSGAVEKAVVRRQRMMIKNRERAARSRASKQAYTLELEAEVAEPKDKNQDLKKKQAEIMEMQNIQGEPFSTNMVRKRDRFWEYAEDLKGRFICKFCSREFPGGVARLKSHLSQQERRDIAICPCVPDNVQASALLAIRGNEKSNKRSMIGSSSLHVGGHGVDSSFDAHDSISGLHQATISGMCHKKDKESLDKALAKTLFMNNILFSVIQDPSFIEFCKTLSNYGVGYSVPSYSTLCTKLVQNARVEVDDYVSKVKESWTETGSGCTLMSDGWTDLKGRSFINMIAYSPKGAIFLKLFEETSAKKTGVYLRDLFCYAIEEIKAENVVQIITNNASNYESAGQMVMKRYPHIYKTQCAAHGIQLLLKDIYKEVDWVKSIFDDAKDIVDYIYESSSVLTLMRTMTGDKELKRPCKTRFAYNFLMLQSILEVEDELHQMVASYEWRSMEYYTSEMAQKITNIIQGITFWSDGKEIIFVLEPLIRVLRLVESEGSTAGYLYEAMERAREALKHQCDNDQARYIKIWELFDLRRERNILHCVHAVAAYLNPLLMSSGKIRYDHPDVRKGLLFVVEKLLNSSEDLNAFGIQITEYNTQDSEIFTSLAKHQMETIHPRVWWSQNGGSIPIVQNIAIRILSQPCSSSACERNWSAFEAAQTKERNRLTPNMLEDLIHIRMNLKMEANCDEREKRDKKIINLEQLGELPKYMDDGREEFENVE